MVSSTYMPTTTSYCSYKDYFRSERAEIYMGSVTTFTLALERFITPGCSAHTRQWTVVFLSTKLAPWSRGARNGLKVWHVVDQRVDDGDSPSQRCQAIVREEGSSPVVQRVRVDTSHAPLSIPTACKGLLDQRSE
ncbi:hypothetical protein CSAL01_02858 [Colletotrichum salicis]|uniref:Uncharacterized protein n=1 Tax=Colletotrichum salicis TaxID=1209931 RepID=A0A135S5Z1_9PEZI|nr:hypothetical protein CSAL01_02858 [Colletotrichum salicis]